MYFALRASVAAIGSRRFGTMFWPSSTATQLASRTGLLVAEHAAGSRNSAIFRRLSGMGMFRHWRQNGVSSRSVAS